MKPGYEERDGYLYLRGVSGAPIRKVNDSTIEAAAWIAVGWILAVIVMLALWSIKPS